MDLKDIKAIIDLMKKNAIVEFELEKQDFKIRLKRGVCTTAAAQMDDSLGVNHLPGITSASPAALPIGTAPTAASSGELEVKSPMIGTFYRAPSPEAAAYVELGTEVTPESVVCIIEAMKVMNEIKAEVRGIVTQVLVDNAKPVEFGQPLFRVRPI